MHSPPVPLYFHGQFALCFMCSRTEGMSWESPAVPQVELIGFLFNYLTSTYHHSSLSRTHSLFSHYSHFLLFRRFSQLLFSRIIFIFFKFCNSRLYQSQDWSPALRNLSSFAPTDCLYLSDRCLFESSHSSCVPPRPPSVDPEASSLPCWFKHRVLQNGLDPVKHTQAEVHISRGAGAADHLAGAHHALLSHPERGQPPLPGLFCRGVCRGAQDLHLHPAGFHGV